MQIPPEGEDHLFPRLLSTSPLAFSALFAPSLILMGKVKSQFNVKRSFFFFFFNPDVSCGFHSGFEKRRALCH